MGVRVELGIVEHPVESSMYFFSPIGECFDNLTARLHQTVHDFQNLFHIRFGPHFYSPPNLSGFLVNKDKRPPNLEARHITDIQDNLAQFPKAILVPGDIPHSCIGSRVGIALRVFPVFCGQKSITPFLYATARHLPRCVSASVYRARCHPQRPSDTARPVRWYRPGSCRNIVSVSLGRTRTARVAPTGSWRRFRPDASGRTRRAGAGSPNPWLFFSAADIVPPNILPPAFLTLIACVNSRTESTSPRKVGHPSWTG